MDAGMLFQESMDIIALKRILGERSVGTVAPHPAGDHIPKSDAATRDKGFFAF